MLVLSINYRLGPLGFLAAAGLAAETEHGADSDSPTCDGGPRFGGGMNGLRDVVCALRWVRANILAFGGDPDRVRAGRSHLPVSGA